MSEQEEYPIEIPQGADFDWPLFYMNSDESPYNLNGYSARMQIRETYADTDLLADLTVQNGGIAINGVLGSILVHIPAANTAGYPANYKGVYDLLLTSPANAVARIAGGPVFVSPSVTR